jgi:hypothetical protein
MANPEIDNYVPPTPLLSVGRPYPFENAVEREERFRKDAKQLLVTTLKAIQNMGYYVAPTNTNSDVDVKSMEGWFTLNKIK